jgi:hypothetical protein
MMLGLKKIDDKTALFLILLCFFLYFDENSVGKEKKCVVVVD